MRSSKGFGGLRTKAWTVHKCNFVHEAALSSDSAIENEWRHGNLLELKDRARGLMAPSMALDKHHRKT